MTIKRKAKKTLITFYRFIKIKNGKTLKMIIDSYIINLFLRDLAPTDTRNTLLVFFVALAFVLFVQWLINFYKFNKSLPPGPWGIPVIGYLLFMGSEKHTRFMELAKSYGSVYSAKLGNQLTVVLSDHLMIREAFRSEAFTGRPDTPFLQTINGFGKFIISIIIKKNMVLK